MTLRHLDRLLDPVSVAVFGASERPGAVGTTVWRNLRRGGFRGPVYAVNPKHATIDGQKAWPHAAALPSVPELAVLCTPAATIPGLVAELGALGTKAAIVVTAGLTAAQKQAALDAARPHLLRLLGPNCLGLLSPRIGLNASFAHVDALPGELAFVSQSGALVTAVLDWARSREIGFSHLVSLGEHCDVDFGDLLDHLGSDAATRAILLYVEAVPSPRKFMSAARAAARNKPVIIVKAGRAAAGMRAAASHTGALAGSDAVYDAAIRRAGMLRVDTLQQLFLAAETLARLRGNRDDRLTIVTNGGGAGVMAADAAERLGVPLAPMTPALREHLDAALPANWSGANPVDLIGDAPVQRYVDALTALLQAPEAGALLFIHAPTAIVDSAAIAQALLPLLRQHPGKVMGCWLGDAAVRSARQQFVRSGIADFATPEEAVQAFALQLTYRRNQDSLMEMPAASEAPEPDRVRARAALARSLEAGRQWMAEAELAELMAAYGVPMVPSRLVTADPVAAARASQEVGFPAVLKLRAHGLTHKSDFGGVQLDLPDAAAVQQAAERMLRQVSASRPDVVIDGFTVQPMIRRPRAHELIVGASVDPTFGPVLLFGQGGTAVEVTADRALALPPLNRSLARELVSRTRVSRLLAGYRDRPAVREEALLDLLVTVSQMVADLPELAELDLNPVSADDSGVLVLDARVRLCPSRPGGAARFAIRPYPVECVRRLRWEDRELTVRPIRPEDETQHLRFIERLSPEDIRMRIFQTRRELPRSELARLTQIDYEREMAYIAVDDSDPAGPQTLGVARMVRDPDNTEAEFAVIVRSDLKGRGLGRLLLDTLIEHARAHGTPRLVGIVLRENREMLTLAHRLGFTVEPSRPGGDTAKVVLRLDARDEDPVNDESAPGR